MRRVALLLLLWLAAVLPAAAQAPSPEQVRRLMDAASLDDSLASLPLQIQAQSDLLRRAAKDEATARRAAQALMRAFDPKKARERAAQYIASQAQAEEVKRMLSWLDSPLGEAVRAADRRAGLPAEQEKLAAYAQQLKSSPPPEERLQAIRKLDENGRLSQHSMRIVGEAMKGVIRAGAAAGGEALSDQAAQAKLKEQLASIEEPLRQTILVSMLHAYRDFRERGLEQYAGFLASETGQRYTELVMGAVAHALQGYVNDALKDLGAAR